MPTAEQCYPALLPRTSHVQFLLVQGSRRSSKANFIRYGNVFLIGWRRVPNQHGIAAEIRNVLPKTCRNTRRRGMLRWMLGENT